jgi:membrane-bound lytic murein transglycosylase D
MSSAVLFAVVCSLFSPAPVAAWPGALLDLGAAAPPAQPEELFPSPAALAPAVTFWTRVFSEIDDHQALLHDSSAMTVWRIIELPVDESGTVIESEVSDRIREATDRLQARLRRLARNPTPQDERDRELLKTASEKPGRLDGAWRRVRGQRGVANRFRDGLERAERYLAQIRAILVAEGLPPDLAALPFVESMFDPRARSSAGAAGMWQLMPATAREFGLAVKKGKDERLHVTKSSRAAARMLRKNHEMLGTWPLAITGYNHGPYGMRRAVKKHGTTDLVYLIENYEKSTWGFASKNFYAEFLAAAALLEQHEQREAALVATEGAENERL